MRVAFCIDNMNVGGTEMNAVRLAGHLVAAGVDLRVFCLSDGGPLRERYAALGVPVQPLPLGSLYGRSALRQGARLAAALREERVDVLHAHDFYSNIFAAPWALRAGVPFIASRRWWEGPERRLQRWANRASYVLANRVVANSPAIAGLLTRQERVTRGAVAVVPNFLDEEAFAEPPASWRAALQAELSLPADALVAGVVASLQPIKDHATLLRAVARLLPDHPALHLVLVGGDSGSRGALESLADSLGIRHRVRFAGLRPAIPSMHWLFDVSALTSVSEGLPNSVLEAMAAGRPVVATRVGAVPDAVNEGVTGFLVPPGNADAVASALGTLLADPSLRASMGAAAQAAARTGYSAQAALDAVLAVYGRACGRPFRPASRPAAAGAS